MCERLADLFASLGIPQAEVPISRSSRNCFSVRAERGTINQPIVGQYDALGPSDCPFPKSDFAVNAARSKALLIGAHRHGVHRALVLNRRAERSHRCNIPQTNLAIGTASPKCLAVVAIAYGADCFLVDKGQPDGF